MDTLGWLLDVVLTSAAMPEPVPADVPVSRAVLEEQPLLSTSVANSINNFESQGPLPRKITPADLFVDIAKHGKGASVHRLRARHRTGRDRGVGAPRRRDGDSAALLTA